MKLSHDGDHWPGTFGHVLGVLCEDLLTEGPLGGVSVTYEAEGSTATIEGTLAGCNEAWLILDGDNGREAVLRSDVLSIATGDEPVAPTFPVGFFAWLTRNFNRGVMFDVETLAGLLEQWTEEGRG